MKNEKKNTSPTLSPEEKQKQEQLKRIKETQERIKNGTHDTRGHVLRDVRAALALLDLIESDPEILALVVNRLEQSILNLKP